MSTQCATATNLGKFTELPKRLFGRLDADADKPLAFHRNSMPTQSDPRLNVNAHNGFALAMAVHASSVPLVRCLLAFRANPSAKHAIAVIVPIRKKDLKVVCLLLEPLQYPSRRPRIPQNILPREYPGLLKVAMKMDAISWSICA